MKKIFLHQTISVGNGTISGNDVRILSQHQLSATLQLYTFQLAAFLAQAMSKLWAEN